MPAPIILSPPALDDDESVASGLTRQAYRRAIAEEFGHFAVLTVTSTASTGTTPDAARQILCTAMRADQKPPSRLDHHYVYVVDGAEAGSSRMVLSGSYDGADASLLLDAPYATPLAAGTTIEITNTLPGGQYMDIAGFNEVVDWALGRLTIWVRLAFTGDGTNQYPLLAYPWLGDDEISHIEDRELLASTDATAFQPSWFRVQTDGVTRTLVTDLTYGSSESFTVVAIRRADSWINAGGVWAAGSGLTSDSDQAAAPLHHVRVKGVGLACRYLIDLTDEDETLSEDRRARRIARWTRRLEGLREPLRRIHEEELPRRKYRQQRPIQGTTFATVEAGGVLAWP